jgi:hypothetical protein
MALLKYGSGMAFYRLNCDFYRKIAKSPAHSYSEVVEGNRLISIPTELVFGSFSHDPEHGVAYFEFGWHADSFPQGGPDSA